MAVPKGWSIKLNYVNRQLHSVSDVRAICPHCKIASTFTLRGNCFVEDANLTNIHLFLECNYTACKKIVYACTAIERGFMQQRPSDLFFMYPSSALDSPHPSVPPKISNDWIEAQRANQASAPNAVAVMLRRVLYGVLIDKGCKLRPLHDGLTELIAQQRLPAIFDEWLPAIKDDGHDGAHPDRALQVSTENVAETMEYTSELLRFLYIEPYEFQQRKSRNQATISPGAAKTEK